MGTLGNISGFTFVEVVVATGILLILASLLVGVGRGVFYKAEMPACMQNLRSLHLALSTHMADKGTWPQLPPDITVDSREESRWWRTNLAPFGMTERAWVCPTLRRMARQKEERDVSDENHYVPTLFDDKPGTAFRWPKMPWAMEIGNNHGAGTLIVMMDGRVISYREFHATSRP